MNTLQDSRPPRARPRNEWLFTGFELALFAGLTALPFAVVATMTVFGFAFAFNDTGRPIDELTAQMPGFFWGMMLVGAGPGLAAGVSHGIFRRIGVGQIARIFASSAVAFAAGLAEPMVVDYGEMRPLAPFAALLMATGAAGAGLFLFLVDMRRKKKTAA